MSVYLRYPSRGLRSAQGNGARRSCGKAIHRLMSPQKNRWPAERRQSHPRIHFQPPECHNGHWLLDVFRCAVGRQSGQNSHAFSSTIRKRLTTWLGSHPRNQRFMENCQGCRAAGSVWRIGLKTVYPLFLPGRLQTVILQELLTPTPQVAYRT